MAGKNSLGKLEKRGAVYVTRLNEDALLILDSPFNCHNTFAILPLIFHLIRVVVLLLLLLFLLIFFPFKLMLLEQTARTIKMNKKS